MQVVARAEARLAAGLRLGTARSRAPVPFACPCPRRSGSARSTTARYGSALAIAAALDGFWSPSLLEASSSSPESSGTGFLVFGPAAGVASGVLARADYEPAIRAGWAALLRTVDADGRVGFVRQVGDRPESALASDSQFYGADAFVMAAVAVHDLRWR